MSQATLQVLHALIISYLSQSFVVAAVVCALLTENIK